MVSRFYHTDLEACKEIPMDQLQVYLSRIEALSAHESLQAIRNAQLGSGFMDKKDSKPIIKELEEQQRILFVGAEDLEKRKAAMIQNLMSLGLPLEGARGLPPM